ncbi:MAG: hypothetical protein AAFQ98_08550 [Bacteroidota bacterium]
MNEKERLEEGTRNSSKRRRFRIILSSFFHLVFLVILTSALIVSFDEELLLNWAFEVFAIIEYLKWVMGSLLFLYLFVITLHFIEIMRELRQARKVEVLSEEIKSLKAKIYDLTQEEEAQQEKMQAFKDSLDTD